MSFPKPTRAELAAIQRELLNVELELKPIPDEFGEVPIDCFPKRQYVTPCGHKLSVEEDLASGIDYLDKVLLKERKRAESNKTWAFIWFWTAVLLLIAFIGLARGMRF